MPPKHGANADNFDKAAKFTSVAVRALVFLLVTMLAIGIWMLADMDTADAVENPAGYVKVGASGTEFLLVLVLLFLNVAMTYSIYKRFGAAGRKVRISIGTIIASLLAMCAWIGLRFLPGAVDLSCVKSVGRIEIMVAFVLILTSVLGMLLLLRKYTRAKPVIKMSAYSKKVLVDGKWVSIEEYLAGELGIEVSHGMTNDERDLVMKDFNERVAKEGIPHPSDGKPD
jgi:hypothetical protein